MASKVSEQAKTQIKNTAERGAKNAVEKLSDGMVFAVGMVLPNMLYGAHWGFPNGEQIAQYEQAIKADGHISVAKLANGYIIEVPADYVLNVAVAGMPGVINNNDVERMKNGLAEADADFTKFLIRKGKEGGFDNIVGIYCVNNQPTVAHKGVDYPAFRVNLTTALNRMNQWGYGIYLQNKVLPPVEANAHAKELLRTASLSPSQNAVFIRVKAMQAPEWYAGMEKQRKEQRKAASGGKQ